MNEVTTNGKFWRTDWNKNTYQTTAQTAGTWYCLFQGMGNPVSGTVFGTGTNRTFQTCSDTIGGGLYHGGDVSPDTKHILNASAFSAAATSMPAVFMLVDLLGFYPISTVTTTGNQAMTNSLSLPRYTDGAGVQAFLVPSTVMGAGTPNISLVYSSSDNVQNKATPTVLPIGNTTAPITQIVYSGTGAGKYGPFIPLAAGDRGIKLVESFSLSTTYTSGFLNLCLCKPLLTLPMTTIGVAAERDLLNQVPSLPQVKDGACLVWLMYAGAATPVNSAFYGHLDFGWG